MKYCADVNLMAATNSAVRNTSFWYLSSVVTSAGIRKRQVAKHERSASDNKKCVVTIYMIKP